MTELSATPAEIVKLSRYCGDCGYPITDENCPECGGGAVPRLHLIERRRTLGRIFSLLALSWGAEAVMLLLMFLPILLINLVPALGGAARLYVGFMQILYSATAICTALAAISVAKGLWILSTRARTLVRIATAGFLVSAGRRLLMVIVLFVPAGPLVLLVEWIEWPVWIFGAFAAVVLLRALGICSRMDPGGRDRSFLGMAWVSFSIIMGVYLFFAMTRWLSPNQAVDSAFQAIALILLGVQTLFLAAVVGSMIPWKRMLTRCAANDNDMRS